MNSVSDFAILLPAAALSSLIIVAYVLGKERGETEERRKAAVRRAHRTRKEEMYR